MGNNVRDRPVTLPGSSRTGLRLFIMERFRFTRFNRWGIGLSRKAKKIGLRKGIEKGKAEMAKKALEEGVSIDLISKISGLTIEEVEKL
ncbi:MAG: hypothetical protein GY757_32995 [bacterium]|nr:hypothetical protein [bacterium]